MVDAEQVRWDEGHGPEEVVILPARNQTEGVIFPDRQKELPVSSRGGPGKPAARAGTRIGGGSGGDLPHPVKQGDRVEVPYPADGGGLCTGLGGKPVEGKTPLFDGFGSIPWLAAAGAWSR